MADLAAVTAVNAAAMPQASGATPATLDAVFGALLEQMSADTSMAPTPANATAMAPLMAAVPGSNVAMPLVADDASLAEPAAPVAPVAPQIAMPDPANTDSKPAAPVANPAPQAQANASDAANQAFAPAEAPIDLTAFAVLAQAATTPVADQEPAESGDDAVATAPADTKDDTRTEPAAGDMAMLAALMPAWTPPAAPADTQADLQIAAPASQDISAPATDAPKTQAPQQPAPEQPAPQQAAPQQAAPQQTEAPQSGAQPSAPQQSVPLPSAPQPVVAEQPVVQQTAPQQTATAQPMPQQPVAEQPVAEEAKQADAAPDAKTVSNGQDAPNPQAFAPAPAQPAAAPSDAASVQAAAVNAAEMLVAARVQTQAQPAAKGDTAQAPAAPKTDGKPAAKAKADSAVAAKSDIASKTEQQPVDSNDQAAPVQQPMPAETARPTIPDARPQTAEAPAPQPARSEIAAPVQPQAPIQPQTVAAEIEVARHSRGSADTPTPFDKLGVTIAAKSLDGLHQFEIRLDPVELGRVDVQLTVDSSGKAQANLIVDNPKTLELLQRDASSLNRALSDAGLNMSNAGLNFSLREQQQQTSGGNSQRARGRNLSVNAALAANASATRAASGSYAPNSVRLDIRV